MQGSNVPVKIRCMQCMKVYASQGQRNVCPYCGYVDGTPPKEPFALVPGTQLNGRYLIGTMVSSGGFGIVYRAWDPVLEALVAVKEFFPGAFVNRSPGSREVIVYDPKRQKDFQKGKAGFLQEARNTARFSQYENIVRVYNFFEENGTAYMVMEYMEGMSLKEYLKRRGGRIPWQEAVSIAVKFMEALAIVHNARLLHRDISPDNIFLLPDGRVKLFDLGAARFGSDEEEMKRTIVLKVGYAPPEQYRSRSKQGPGTDIYAMGGTLYRIITGSMPPDSLSRAEARVRRQADPLIPPKMLVPEIPEYLNTALLRAMALNMDVRFKSCDSFTAALLNRKPAATVEQEERRIRRRRRILAACLLLFVAAALALSLYVYRDLLAERQLDTAITIWVPGDGETEDAFRQMAATFQEAYPETVLTVTAIPEEDYAASLLKALEDGNLPTIYDSTGLSGSLEGRMADLGELYGILEEGDRQFAEDGNYVGLKMGDYHFLDLALRENGQQLPLAFHATILYWNIDLLGSDGVFPGNDEDAFLSLQSAALFSDEGIYEEVQSAFPIGYHREKLPDEILLSGARCLSVDSAASSLEQKAAMKLLECYLGKNALQILWEQGESSFPIHDGILEELYDGPQFPELLELPLDSVRMEGAEELEGSWAEMYEEMFSETARNTSVQALIEEG